MGDSRDTSPVVVFDVDGTLLQTQLVTVPAVQQTFVRYGLPEPDVETICSFFGVPVEWYHDWLASLCPEGRVDEIVRATDKRELELIGESGQLYPGAREAIESLHAMGCAMVISSNGPDDYVGEFLDAHDLRHFFSLVRARGQGFEGKSHMLKDILDHYPGHRAVVVGDRGDDVESAHANGALAVAVTYGFGSAEELRDADATLHAADEIPAAVCRLLGLQEGDG